MTTPLWTIAAVAIIIVLALLAIAYQFKKAPIASFGPDDASFLDWLRAYETWYTKASRGAHRVLSFCRITPIVIGFAVAVVAASQGETLPIYVSGYGFTIEKNIVIIILTGIVTLCVSILGQLRVADLARARETGRINTAALVARAQLFFSVDHSPDEALKEKNAIKDELFKLEHDQASLFASLAMPAKP
jgi:hypothetical protein